MIFKMEEEKRDVDMQDTPDVGDDIAKMKTDVKVIRMELAELRAAFFNLANEMKLLHEENKKHHKDMVSGIVACRQAFYKCKIGYERVAEAYENIEDGIDSAAGMISGSNLY